MKRFLSLIAMLTLSSLARGAAPVVTNIANFPSVSVAYTNYVSELITTNGVTIGGVRNTAWPSGGVANTVVNSGTPITTSIPTYSGTTGTNIVPSSVTITALTNLTAGNIIANGQFRVGAGTTTTPSLAIRSANLGFYSEAADTLSFIISGSRNFSFSGFGIFVRSADPVVTLGNGSGDLILRKTTGPMLQLGTDAAAPTDQYLKAPNGSGADKNGGKLTLLGGISTGTGNGGDLIEKTSLTGASTGSTTNNVSTRRYTPAAFVNLVESTATQFAVLSCSTNQYVGANIVATVFASDGTLHQALTSRIQIDCINTNGVCVPTITQVDNTAAVASGTLTCSYTAVNGTNTVILKANAVSSLAQTVLRNKCIISEVNSSDPASFFQ